MVSPLPTLYDVAKEAGVSLATASRALNGSSRVVNEGYVARVIGAAMKLGYSPNLSAQAVARGTSATIALLVSDIADPYFSTIAAGVMRAAGKNGLNVTMAVTERDAVREVELVRLLRGQRPRILVLAGSRFVDEAEGGALVAELKSYTAAGGRVVLISRHGMPFDTVAIDNTGGAAALARSLVEIGYLRFAILAGPANLVTAAERSAAFASALPHPPAAVVAVVHSAFSRDGGYDGMLDLIDRGLDGIDLVFAVNDVMAIGALAALRDRGIDVPARVAVAGYDDISTTRDVTPALTTVRIDLEEAGAAAVTLALGDGGLAHIAAEVVMRASTPRRNE